MWWLSEYCSLNFVNEDASTKNRHSTPRLLFSSLSFSFFSFSFSFYLYFIRHFVFIFYYYLFSSFFDRSIYLFMFVFLVSSFLLFIFFFLLFDRLRCRTAGVRSVRKTSNITRGPLPAVRNSAGNSGMHALAAPGLGLRHPLGTHVIGNNVGYFGRSDRGRGGALPRPTGSEPERVVRVSGGYLL